MAMKIKDLPAAASFTFEGGSISRPRRRKRIPARRSDALVTVPSTHPPAASQQWPYLRQADVTPTCEDIFPWTASHETYWCGTGKLPWMRLGDNFNLPQRDGRLKSQRAWVWVDVAHDYRSGGKAPVRIRLNANR
jgi:hypothetical protein